VEFVKDEELLICTEYDVALEIGDQLAVYELLKEVIVFNTGVGGTTVIILVP